MTNNFKIMKLENFKLCFKNIKISKVFHHIEMRYNGHDV